MGTAHQALNEGASRIVVSEVLLTISNHTAEGKELIQALQVEDYVPIRYTGPLYDSRILRSMFVQRANEQLGDVGKSRVGILLVGHGVQQVLYFSAAVSADSMHSQHDVPVLVQKARVTDGLSLINMGAWNDDPRVIQAVKEKIEAQRVGWPG